MTGKYETGSVKRGHKDNLGNYNQANNCDNWFIHNNIKINN